MKNFFSILLILIFHNSLSSQCFVRDISLSDRSSRSSNVIFAKVMNYTTYQKNGHIYTKYQLETIESKEKVFLETIGGTLNDLIEVVTPSLKLKEGDQGLFYLTEANNSQKLYKPTVGVLSFLKYENNKFKDFLNTYDINEINVDNHILNKFISKLTQDFNPPKGVINLLAQPKIYSISPKIVTAGTKQKITITGKNFGNNATGKALLEFRNPDYATGTVKAYQSVAPNHIISWKDNKIEVIVPGRDPYLNKSGAGSGNIRLRNTAGKVVFSSQKITVLYNQFCNSLEGTVLVDDNDFGGYTLTYNREFLKNSNRISAFERALETWQCNIHSSFVSDGSVSEISCPKNDGVNLISFDKNCKLSPELLAQTTHWYIKCSEKNTILLEMDMIFNNRVKWHYDTSEVKLNKFDFESIALHELGHAHGMGHVLEESNIMFTNYFPNDIKRDLDTNSINCGIDIINRSSKYNNCNDIDSIIPYPDCSLPCNLTLSVIQSSDCLMDSFVEYNISVQDINGSGLGFNIFVDSKLQSISPIKYSLSRQTNFKINIPADGSNHTIKIHDLIDKGTCWDELTIVTPNCKCSLESEINQISNCKDGKVTYAIKTISNRTSDSKFKVFIDGIVTKNSPYNYSGTGITFININISGDNEEHLIKIQDIQDSTCSSSTLIITPDCNCSMNLVITNNGDCTDLQEIPYLLQIITKNKGNSGFDLYIDDKLLSDSPITYSSSDTTTIYINIKGDGASHNIRIDDHENDECSVNQSISVPNCLCDIDLEIKQTADCNNESNIAYLFTINNSDINALKFHILIDNIELLGSPFDFNSSGSTLINSYLKGDGKIHIIKIWDDSNPNCKISQEFFVPDCSCNMTVKHIISSDCTENSERLHSLLLINKKRSIEGFKVWVDNKLTVNSPYSYSSGDSTIIDILIQGDGLLHNILIQDVKNINCKIEIDVESEVCECNLSLKENQISGCDENQLTLWTLEIDRENTTSKGFYVFLDNVLIDSALYSITSKKTFLNIQIPGDNLNHLIKIQDRNNPICFTENNIISPDCQCKLSLEAAIESDCQDNLYVEILGSIIQKNIFSDSFNVYVDSLILDGSPFNYESSTFSNFRFKLIGDGKYHLIEIKDYNDEDCYANTTILLPNCNDIEKKCKLKFLSVKTKDCQDGKFEINFSFTGTKNPLYRFNLYKNNKLYTSSPFEYHTSGINNISLTSNCEETEIKIIDLQLEGCEIDTTITPSYSNKDFALYPNPVFFDNVKFFITGIDKKDHDILLPTTIFNILGKKVYKGYLLGNNKMKLDLRLLNLSSGVYFLKLGNNNKYGAKFVISK